MCLYIYIYIYIYIESLFALSVVVVRIAEEDVVRGARSFASSVKPVPHAWSCPSNPITQKYEYI